MAMTRNGIPWHLQKLDGSVLDVLEEVRRALREGHFTRRSCDHNNPGYIEGVTPSNKRIKIAGAILMGWADPEDPGYDRCYDAVMEAVLGRSQR